MIVESSIEKCERQYRLGIPTWLIKSMGWEANTTYKIKLTPDPDNNTITIQNSKRQPVGMLKFMLAFKQQQWVRNREKYDPELKETLSPEDRKTREDNAMWKKVPDGAYHRCTFLKERAIELYEESENTTDETLKESLRQSGDSEEKLANSWKEYLEEQGFKIDRDLTKTLKKLDGKIERTQKESFS